MSTNASQTIVTSGVVAEYKGQYWGIQYQDGHSTSYGFGELAKALIRDPRFCKSATDLTWTPEDGRHNSDYDALSKAQLLTVKKTIVIEVGAA